MRKLAILFGGAALLAACQPRTPVEPAPAAVVDPNNPLLAPGYMAMAASGDQFEIQSSQLAMQMSQNMGVRNLASMLIADHTRMSQTMMAAAQAAGLTPPPPVLLPPHQAMLDQLRAAGAGPSFDMAYQQVQVQAHQQALQLHQNYAASGDHPALRTVASQAVGPIQMHLQQAQMLQVAPPPPPPAPPPIGRSGERG